MFKSKIVEDDLIDNTKGSEEIEKHFHDFSRKLMCIEYPGVVENVDNMLHTFGGLQSLEMAVGTKQKRVELRFRPEDVYCKPCFGDKEKKPGILVKVKIRQPKLDLNLPCSSTSEIKLESSYEYEVVGITAMVIKFNRMCDFQYLPLLSLDEKETPSSPVMNIHEKVFPEKLPDLSYIHSEEAKTMPLFFPPSIFSRYSRPIQIDYDKYEVFEKSLRPEMAQRYKARQEKIKKQRSEQSPIAIARKPRPTYSIFVKFEDPVYPTEPPVGLPSLEELNLLDEYNKMKALFMERPIWSRTGLQHRSQVGSNKMKHILTHLAYHCSTGPWRVMWVRFGYDPRKKPDSRIYQTFDYRVRSDAHLKKKIKARERSTILGYHGGSTDIKKFSLENHLFEEYKGLELPTEPHYILRPDIIPASRQMFYQYCDLQLPEIQSMLARLPKVSPDTKCHPKNGWLPDDFSAQCREIVQRYVHAAVRKQLLEEQKIKAVNQSRNSSGVDVTDGQTGQNSSAEIAEEEIEECINLVSDDDNEINEENVSGNDNSEDSDNIATDEEMPMEDFTDINKLLNDLLQDKELDLSLFRGNEISEEFQQMDLDDSEDSDVDSN